MKKPIHNTNLIKVLPINHISTEGNPIYSDIECIGESVGMCEYMMNLIHSTNKKIIGFDVVKLSGSNEAAEGNSDCDTDLISISYRDN